MIKKEQPKEMLLESYDDIHTKLNRVGDFSRNLTDLQYSNYVKNNINNHYVKWSGEIENVGREPIDNSMIAYVKISGFNEFKKYQWTVSGVELYDIPEEELIKLNKGDKILFTGKIMELDKGLGAYINWEDFLKLYDVEILEHDK